MAGSQDLPTSPFGGGGGGGAPTTAQYVTLAVDGTLTNERVLTAGVNVTLTDGGAGSTVTVAAFAGATTFNVVTTSANPYNFGATDSVIFANPTSDQMLSLPFAGTHTGRVLTIKRVAVNGFTVTVNTGGENIDGSTSVLLSGHDSVSVISDGTNWRVI